MNNPADHRLTTQPVSPGFFVDWSGKTRSIGSNADGVVSRIALRSERQMVEVVDSEGFVTYEADYHPDLDSIKACGATVELLDVGT